MSADRPVPDCVACGKPLGLYYAECQTCFAWAHVYSFSDYFPQGADE